MAEDDEEDDSVISNKKPRKASLAKAKLYGCFVKVKYFKDLHEELGIQDVLDWMCFFPPFSRRLCCLDRSSQSQQLTVTAAARTRRKITNSIFLPLPSENFLFFLP